ncbi:MAG: rhodanese-like domain-containing protein [Chromatiales bacterium]|nr:rhodanese-like domain-containing protein [Chromatiales bacterium]
MNRLLPLSLIILPLAACVGSGPDVDNRVAGIAQSIARGEDRVSVDELGSWIVADQGNLAVVDMRPEAEYAAGAIQGAKNLSLAQLMNGDTMAELAGKKLVLYSQDSADAAQAAALLRVTGREAFSLSGGYSGWEEKLSGGAPASDNAAAEKDHALSCYFAKGYEAPLGLPSMEDLANAVPTSDNLAALSPSELLDMGYTRPPGMGYTPQIKPVASAAPAAGGGKAKGLVVDEGC